MAQPPISVRMCIHACEHTDNMRLKSICEKCVASKPVADGLCLYACANSDEPYIENDWFQRICDQCFAPPLPLNETTCVNKCSSFHNARFQNICKQCVANPPCSEKLCMYACHHKFVNNRFREICERCWYTAEIPETDEAFTHVLTQSLIDSSNTVNHALNILLHTPQKKCAFMHAPNVVNTHRFSGSFVFGVRQIHH